VPSQTEPNGWTRAGRNEPEPNEPEPNEPEQNEPNEPTELTGLTELTELTELKELTLLTGLSDPTGPPGDVSGAVGLQAKALSRCGSPCGGGSGPGGWSWMTRAGVD
jgi:hypothetical protein